MPRLRLLFLDFDGVAHPGISASFSQLPLIQAFLRAHPEVGVVFSTTWRTTSEFTELKSLFDADLQERILGCTPDRPGGAHSREDEIRYWLQQANLTECRWVALDDDASLYSPWCPNLVLCDTTKGVRQAQLIEAAQKLGYDI